ncbi:MAG: dehydrogenase subunit [Planctomycetota bacterium]|jgi:NADH-quinone oxidoreductase subunit M
MIGALGWCVAGPLLAAVAALLTPPRWARWWALAASLLPLAVGLVFLTGFALEPGAGFRGVESHPWSAALGAGWTLGVDGPGAAMLALAGLVSAIATVSGWNQERHPRAYHALVLLLLAAMDAVFTALDLVVFVVGWEVMLVPMLVLIGVWGGEQRRYAALKFLLMTLAGGAALILLLAVLWRVQPAAPSPVAVSAAAAARYQDADGRIAGLVPVMPPAGEGAGAPGEAATRAQIVVAVPRGFDLRHLALRAPALAHERALGLALPMLGLIAVALACLVKIPAVPLHTWLPHAHVQAPTAVSVLLAGILLKLGVFGLWRVAWPLFPDAVLAAAPVLGGLGLAGLLWTAWVALGQRDLKRLVAYSSVSHMGWCLIGLASLTTAGALGAMVQAVAHGFSSALLFLLVGVLYDRAHHRRIDGFGGLVGPMPRFCWVLLIACLAGAGLPALAGFVGEALAFIGAVHAGGGWGWVAAAAAPSVVLAAAYNLWAYQRVATGPLRHPEQAAFPDLDRRELVAVLPLVALLLLVGLWPAPLVDALRPALEAANALVHEARP